ncbi:MAG TPA: FAD-dependent oxidoreductase [Thermoleophilaceae bacterium]
MAHDANSDPGRADVIVVGAGAAGLYTALVAAREGARVALISRSPLAESASYWAQGGIAAALADDDSAELHLDDTLTAGRGASRESAARVLCDEAPQRVRDLERLGVRFDADRRGALALGLEGGHSRRRVVHAGGSATGRRITRDLSALAALDERVEVIERTAASGLWVHDGRCIGVLAEDRHGRERVIAGRGAVLATGGAAALWRRTSNPRGATGVGMTLAHAAGADLADIEFMQFHPTALVHPDDAHDGFLITEAVRGEGAKLLTDEGERFVDELSPRDEVALAVQAQLQAGRTVLLDMREIDLARFPNIVSALADAGIDPAREPVPVAPAAHYTMGGVATSVDGASSLPGLYAVGECGCTGLHGANRLASNSLAECFVFGHRAALAALGEPDPGRAAASAPRPARGPSPTPPQATRDALWQHAGLQRTRAGLEHLLDDSFPLARLIARSALEREESRGAHQRGDYPVTDPGRDGLHLIVDTHGDARWEHWR